MKRIRVRPATRDRRGRKANLVDGENRVHRVRRVHKVSLAPLAQLARKARSASGANLDLRAHRVRKVPRDHKALRVRLARRVHGERWVRKVCKVTLGLLVQPVRRVLPVPVVFSGWTQTVSSSAPPPDTPPAFTLIPAEISGASTA